VIPADETYDGTFPFAPHFSTAPGFRMHHVDEGAGEPVVLLHGEPTWGYLYRHMIPPLAAHHRVVVPDHMGFGKSETPQDRDYGIADHVGNLAALLDDLGLDGITLVAQDWGGPIATAYALRNPGRVRRLVHANTVNLHASVDGLDSPWFRWIAAGIEDGRTDTILSHLGSTALSVMKRLGFTNSAAVTDTWIRAYEDPFPTPADARGAVAWPREAITGAFAGYVRQGVADAGGLDGLRAIPAVLAEGMRDRAIPPAVAIANFRAVWPGGPVVELPGAGHFCQEDAPEALVAVIRQHVQTT